MTNNQIIVRRENGLFVLRAFQNGEWLERVQVPSAQMIVDYVRATWPVGTIIKWRIRPEGIA